jgi:hypothetical protein
VILSNLIVSMLFILAPNDIVELELANGDTVTGRLSSVQPGSMYVSSPVGAIEVNLELISHARINDSSMELDVLRSEVAELWENTSERLNPVGDLPNAYWAATSSALLPGSGQRMLGQERAANSYLFADLALLSLGGWLILDRQDYGNALPLLGLDLIFRIYSAAEAYKDTRWRTSLMSGERHIGH